MGQIKQVVFDCDEELWTEAKIQAIKEKTDLKEWVSNAIKEKLKNSLVISNTKS